MDENAILTYGLAALAAGAALFVAYPYLSGNIKAERRRDQMRARPGQAAAGRVVDAGNRRKQITDSIKDLEGRGKRKRKVSLDNRIGQAGLAWSVRTFVLVSAALGLGLGAVAYAPTGNPMIAGPALLVGALGVPRWYLGYQRRKRMTRFLKEFPNAVDVIVRGIKAGLPLADCIRIVATEAAEPVRSEFRRIVEAQSIGFTLSEAVERLVDRVPVPEANFFSIVVGIQQKAGGNLSEALSNLSRVLRDRKKMKAKVKAVASEANASAMIIGSMPFVVAGLIYLTSPQYLELLWLTSTGRMMLVVAFVWMSLGVAVMRKMISFEI